MKFEKSGFNSEAAPRPFACQMGAPCVTDSDISVIKFEGKSVRIMSIYGEPWFIAKDVCEALEIADHKVALRRLDSDEKGVCLTPTPGGNQRIQLPQSKRQTKKLLILYGGGRYISPADVNPSVGCGSPFNEPKATQTRQASFFVSCHRAPISSGNARPESMVALVGQSSDWPVSFGAGFLTPISVTTLYERENSGGDSLNLPKEAAIMATTPTQTHPQPVKKSLPVRSTWLYIPSVAQHRATGFDSPNTDADSRNHSVMRSFCVRRKPITPSGARIMVGRGGEAFAPAGFICAGLSTLPRPATLFDSREQVVKPTDEAAIMATTPTQLHPELPKFTFHFLAVRRADPCAKPHRTSVIAPNEREARQLLARDFVLLFAGRVPAQGVRHG